MTFEQLLNPPFDVSLLVTTSMVFFFTIMEPANLSSFVCWLILAFLLSVKLEVNISRCRSDGVLVIDKLNDRFQNVLISYTF